MSKCIVCRTQFFFLQNNTYVPCGTHLTVAGIINENNTMPFKLRTRLVIWWYVQLEIIPIDFVEVINGSGGFSKI